MPIRGKIRFMAASNRQATRRSNNSALLATFQQKTVAVRILLWKSTGTKEPSPTRPRRLAFSSRLAVQHDAAHRSRSSRISIMPDRIRKTQSPSSPEGISQPDP